MHKWARDLADLKDEVGYFFKDGVEIFKSQGTDAGFQMNDEGRAKTFGSDAVLHNHPAENPVRVAGVSEGDMASAIEGQIGHFIAVARWGKETRHLDDAQRTVAEIGTAAKSLVPVLSTTLKDKDGTVRACGAGSSP